MKNQSLVCGPGSVIIIEHVVWPGSFGLKYLIWLAGLMKILSVGCGISVMGFGPWGAFPSGNWTSMRTKWGVEYHGTKICLFRRIIRRFKIRTNHQGLVDYGCGMGRVILLAARYPFRQIIGLEYSKMLVDICQDNINRVAKYLKCHDIHVLNQDANEYILSPDITVFFFYNPFTGDTLRTGFRRIEDRLRARPRPIQIIYYKPVCLEEMIGEFPWLGETDRFTDGLAGWPVVLYENRRYRQ